MVTYDTNVTLQNVSIRRQGKTILSDLSFQIGGARSTIITGPNGAGKTTLLRLLHGMERTSQGTLSWSQNRDAALRKQALIFQTPAMLRRSVLDNLVYPLRLQKVSQGEAERRASQLAEKLELSPMLSRQARQLSGGEKQRLALARALVVDPALLLLDEPTSNLDGANKRQIETMLEHAMGGGTKIIMSTHDMGQAKRLAEEVIFLHEGSVLEKGDAAQFFKQPKTPQAQAYLRGDILE